MPNARSLALEVFHEWNRGEAFAAALIDEIATQDNLESRDTALLQSLVYGVLRNISLLDHWISILANGKEVDQKTRWVLRLGVAQLLILDMPAHASVNETVKAAPRAIGFVNAILRRANRERAELLTLVDSLPLAIRFSHPSWLVERLGRSMDQAQLTAFLEWNQMPAEVYVRANKLHPRAEDFALIHGMTPVRNGFYHCESTPRDALMKGLCYAQDPSTEIAPRLLHPRPGEAVLDACAAPGGKTALMAELMSNQGQIMASDASSARLKRMAGNLDRLRVDNVRAALHDWTRPAPDWLKQQKFDAILLDVPCSNTGVMRRRVDVRWRLKPEDFPTLAESQQRLLRTLINTLKPGGRVVYSTCSIEPEENEQVVQILLKERPKLKLLEEKRSHPAVDGFDGAYAAMIQSPST